MDSSDPQSGRIAGSAGAGGDKAAAPQPRKRRPPRIEVREAFCKVCGICVAFCPTQVLKLKQSHVAVVNLQACTKCMMCELRCPDFAIAVFDPDKGEA